MPEIPEVHIGVVDAAGAESVSWNDVIVGRMALNECWNHTPGSRQSLFTFTNAHSVELLVNGQSMGVQENDTTRANLRNMIYWKDVPYGNGGSVVAIARDKSGKEVARHRIETAGKAVALRIEAETPDGLEGRRYGLAIYKRDGHRQKRSSGMGLQQTTYFTNGRCGMVSGIWITGIIIRTNFFMA